MSVLELPDDMAEALVGCDEVNDPTAVVARRALDGHQAHLFGRGPCNFHKHNGYRLCQHETTNLEVQLQSSSSSSQPPSKWSHNLCDSSNCVGALTSSRNAAREISSGSILGQSGENACLLASRRFDNMKPARGANSVSPQR